MNDNRMLVVDDDDDVRDLILATFARAGYATEGVRGGHAALDAMATATPAAVVLDVDMPDLGGLAVCEALRSDERYRDCPVLLVSAQSAVADVEAGYRAGADDFLSKPFSPGELLGRVERLLRAPAVT